jgi:hypothetical protein
MKTILERELHDGGSTSFTLLFLPISRAAPSLRASRNLRGMTDVRDALPAGACFTHAGNIIRAEYEIEGGTKSMS